MRPIAYTQTLFSFSFRSFRKHRRAREKEKLRTTVDIFGKKGFIKSLPHVNAFSLSPPLLQYQLNLTQVIGDINCSCNWLK